MAINVFLKDDINRLVKPTSRKAELPAIGDKAAIGAKRGSARPVGGVSSGPLSTTNEITEEIYNEVISVYSTIILTEDGAYEKPTGWPDSGDFPIGDPLDTTAAYYEQKRVHLAVFEVVTTDNSGKETRKLITQNYLIKLAYPYEGSTMLGLLNYSNWQPVLYMDSFNTGNAEISALIAQLQTQL